MADERWQVLSDWLSEWLEADPRARVRLRDELAAKHPELVGEADRMSSSVDSMTGFLETPALVLAARELVVDAPVLPAGAMVGPYRVVQLLARGGMGDVYRATDSRLGRDVALKVLSPARTSDPRRVERFLLEARITGSLDHPNIVRVYDVGRVDEQTYLVAELLDGETLRARIVRGAIAPDEARRIALDVARGLAAAHDAGLVHRDLKPENIFLTRTGETKLLDFGIAKLTQDEAVPDGASTLTGVVLGTAGYLAPEQIRGDTVDGRADLFAFGAVLFEMVTGDRAFVRDQIVDTLHAILHDPPALVLEDVPGVPPSLATIVGRLLEKAPAARFQSAAELIGTLERADVGRTRSWPVRQIAGIRAGLRRPVWKAAAAAAVVAAVWVSVLLWNGWSPPAITSIAVLPFNNTADDQEIDYICDGMTDGLIDHLSRAQSLIVIARGTVMRFKGEKDPLKAAQALRVGAVVTGEVSRRGTQVVISVALIHGATGKRRWERTFELPKADLLMTVQDRIVLAIAEGLRLRLSGQERARLGGFGTNSPEAYDLFLKGRSLLYREMEEDDLEARKLFIQATEKDPNFLDAHLAVVGTYARSIGSGYAPPREAAVHAFAALAKAAAIEPNNVAVRVTRAHLTLTATATHDWEATEREYRAVMYEPALFRTVVYHPISLFFVAIGRPDEAVELVKRGLIVDPGNLESRVMLGNYLQQAGRLDEALGVYAKISAEEPEAPDPWLGIAAVYKQFGLFPRAAEARRKAHELAGDQDAVQAFTGVTTESGYDTAEKTVARAELHMLEELATRRYISPFAFAHLHAQIGNRGQALARLEQAFKDGGHAGLMLLKVDPAWDSVRDDPRFADVVRRLGIP
jgi:eukaryotic-like serine/threonine-protein kinase